MKSIFASVALLCASATVSLALPVNSTGNVTPDVIFGSGNANGSFTGVNTNNVELGLRGKLRYDLSGQPQNIFNYDGDRTYTFDPALSDAPSGVSAFNFEFAINSDVSGTGQTPLNTFRYLLSIDYDPPSNTDFTSFDPINLAYADHSLGTNVTGNGLGDDWEVYRNAAYRDWI